MTDASLILMTQRLRIRPLTLADLDGICAIQDAGFGEAARNLRAEWLHWTIASYTGFARLYQPPYGERGIEHLTSGQLIGLAGIVPALAPFEQLPSFQVRLQMPPAQHNTPEIGLYWAIHPDQQRQGYASEAAAAVIRFLFDDLGVGRVVATTEYDNSASIAVMRRLGMTIEANPGPTPAWFQVVGSLWNT